MNTSAPAGRVLVVEDDRAIRDEIADLLHERGYQVMQAEHGQQALDQLQTGELPCVILLDLMMPIMDGWVFRTAQLRSPQIAEVPVVVLTGGGDAAVQARNLGAAGYLRKPFQVEALFRIIEGHCGPGS